MNLDSILSEIEESKPKKRGLMTYTDDNQTIKNIISFTEYYHAPDPYGTKMVLYLENKIITIENHIKVNGCIKTIN